MGARGPVGLLVVGAAGALSGLTADQAGLGQAGHRVTSEQVGWVVEPSATSAE